MLPVTSRNYKPVSLEDHYNKMQTFIDSCNGLPSNGYEYEHILTDGVYIRKYKMRKHTLAVGAIHKKETTLVILKGSLKIFSETGLSVLKAGDLRVSSPGTQRAVFALEDTVMMTLHRAETSNLEDIVAELTDWDLNRLHGVREGRYKLFINGEKKIDEEIKHSSKRILEDRNIQRLSSGGDANRE